VRLAIMTIRSIDDRITSAESGQMALRRMKGLTGILTGVAVVGVIAACGRNQDSVSGLQASQYTLFTIDGHTLPHQISQSGDGTVTTTVNDMLLTIVEDKTWHAVGHQTVTTNGVPVTAVFRNNGTYATSDIPGPHGTTFRDATGDLIWIGDISDREVAVLGADSLVWAFER
jgi:hypothetical protein